MAPAPRRSARRSAASSAPPRSSASSCPSRPTDGPRAAQGRMTLRPSLAERLRLRLLPRRRETVDARLYLAVNHLPHHRLTDEQVSFLSTLGKGAGWVGVGAWLALRDGRRGRRAAVASIGAMLLTVALVQGPVKTFLPRRRPF